MLKGMKVRKRIILAPLFLLLCLALTSFAAAGEADDKCEISYYLGGELYQAAEHTKGESVVEPPTPAALGYSFLGWYYDRELTQPFSLGDMVSEDTSLYGEMSLDKPVFSISSKEVVYSGTPITFGLDALVHPLDKEGKYSYIWYKNGSIISQNKTVEILSVSDSGRYNCKVMFSYNGDFSEIITPTVDVTVEKMVIPAPTVSSKEYNGLMQYSGILPTEHYSVFEEGGISVGGYAVELTLNDSVNTKWQSSEEGTLTLEFEITRAKNYILSVSAPRNIYEGQIPSGRASARFGDVELEYYTALGERVDGTLLAVGEYYFQPRVAEGENYLAAVGDRYYFSVLADYVVGINLEKPPTKTSYLAFDEADISGASVLASYASGRTEPLTVADLRVVYRNGECLGAKDGFFFIYYGEHFCPISVEVSRLEYDISQLVFSDTSCEYNGEWQTISVDFSLFGLDGIPLEYEVIGGGDAAGEYTVELRFSTDSQNYDLPKSLFATITITKKELVAEYYDTEFIYDKLPHSPRAEATLISGERVPLKISSSATAAGEYEATATIENPNYTIKNPTVRYTVKKADIRLDNLSWSQSGFVYNARPHSVVLTGLPEGVSVLGYANATATLAGSYTAVATLGYDSANYNKPESPSFEWQIKKAVYITDSFSFADAVCVYDGELHYPTLSGALPIGLDGVPLSYRFSMGVSEVMAGEVSVEIIFSTESQNYEIPPSLYASVKIEPKPISVLWSGLSFTYDGYPHLPSATAGECEISVLGEQTGAGEYIATAVASNPNYAPINKSVSFRIDKCPNIWTSAPAITDIYESSSPRPLAAAKYGRVEFVYYRASDMQTPLSAISGAGSYYLRAFVPEGDNYLALECEPIAFRVVAVLAENIRVEILADKILACKPLSGEDILVIAVNNDRSEKPLSASEYEIIYESGSCPVRRHTYLTVSYGGISRDIPISVERNSYDLSRVIWESTKHVYDKTKKMPYLSGLPEGVFVTRYTTEGEVNAGVYEVGAILSYDEDNYYKPTIENCRLIIEKCKLKLPYIEPITYDGGIHTAYIEENEYYDFSPFSAKNGGKYKIPLTLKDSENYEFEGEPYAIFEIKPVRLLVTIMSDGRSYRIDSGSVIGSDILSVSFYEDDGYIYIRSDNPSYELIAEPIPISARGRIWIGVISFILVLILALAVFSIVRNRDSLAELISRLKSMRRQGRDEWDKEKENMSILSKDTVLVTDKTHADSLISDALAKSLVSRAKEKIATVGRARAVVYTDTLSDEFMPNDEIDINLMKARGIISENSGHVKVVARGILDKPLRIKANDFDPSAVKMIKLTSGEAVITKTRAYKMSSAACKNK